VKVDVLVILQNIIFHFSSVIAAGACHFASMSSYQVIGIQADQERICTQAIYKNLSLTLT
jgi:hypothetical protein